MPLDRTHQHISSDIIRVDAVHTPIDPSGGASISVTGAQGGSVNGVTSIALAGTATDLGGGVAGQGLVSTRLGPFIFSFDTPNLVDPADNGVLVCAVPATALVRVIALETTTTPDTWDTAAEIDFGLALTSGSNITALARYSQNSGRANGQTDNTCEFTPLDDTLSNLGTGLPRHGYATADTNVWVQVISTGTPPSVGQMTVFVVIETPAS